MVRQAQGERQAVVSIGKRSLANAAGELVEP